MAIVVNVTVLQGSSQVSMVIVANVTTNRVVSMTIAVNVTFHRVCHKFPIGFSQVIMAIIVNITDLSGSLQVSTNRCQRYYPTLGLVASEHGF